MEYKGQAAIRQRTGKDIWQQLYEFPMIEMNKEESINRILSAAEKKRFLPKNNYELTEVSSVYKQQLSHQLIIGRFIKIKLKRKKSLKNDPIAIGWLWTGKNQSDKYAFPQLINQYRIAAGS
jgi:A/G-specific adenine glycosylase